MLYAQLVKAGHIQTEIRSTSTYQQENFGNILAAYARQIMSGWQINSCF